METQTKNKIKTFYCIYHSNQPIQRICEESTCNKPLLCMDCGLTHNKKHSNYITKPIDFFNNVADSFQEENTNTKSLEFPAEFKDLIDNEDKLSKSFFNQCKILKEEIYNTIDILKKDFNKFCDRKQVKLITLVDYPEQTLKNNLIQFREKLQSTYNSNNGKPLITLNDILSKLNRIKKSSDLENFINSLKYQANKSNIIPNKEDEKDYDKINNELRIIKQRIEYCLEQSKNLKIANTLSEKYKDALFTKLDEYFDKEFLNEKLYSFMPLNPNSGPILNNDQNLKNEANKDVELIQPLNLPEKMEDNIELKPNNNILFQLESDSKRPKRPRGAFIQYMAAVKEHHLKVHPELPWRQVVSYASKKWKAMKDNEKDLYMEIARQDRERYWNELRNYKKETNEELNELGFNIEDEDFEEELKANLQKSDHSNSSKNLQLSEDKKEDLPPEKKVHTEDHQPSKALLNYYNIEIFDLPESHSSTKQNKKVFLDKNIECLV